MPWKHGRRSLRKCRGNKIRFPLDRNIVLKIAKKSFTVVIIDKGLCNVSAVRFYQEIMNGHDAWFNRPCVIVDLSHVFKRRRTPKERRKMLEKQATSIEVSPLAFLKHAANLRGHVLED